MAFEVAHSIENLKLIGQLRAVGATVNGTQFSLQNDVGGVLPVEAEDFDGAGLEDGVELGPGFAVFGAHADDFEFRQFDDLPEARVAIEGGFGALFVEEGGGCGFGGAR